MNKQRIIRLLLGIGVILGVNGLSWAFGWGFWIY